MSCCQILYVNILHVVLSFICSGHQHSSSPQQSVTRSDRRERRDDSYIHAPAEQIFDTDDSYFRSSGGAQQEVGGVSRGQGQEKMSGQHYHHYESSSQSAGTRSDGVRY